MMRLYIILFLLVFSCQSNSKQLPVLSYTINTAGEKELYTINYSEFTNQNGEQFTTSNIENKIVIANFFFTRCPSICPPMRTELIKVANEYLNEANVLFVSHSIDSDYDTVSVLKAYSEATGIPSDKWQFLTATEDITKLQAKQFMTNFRPNEDGTDFYHSSYAALVDKNQMIRGFYNILVPEEIERLIDDINLLLK